MDIFEKTPFPKETFFRSRHWWGDADGRNASSAMTIECFFAICRVSLLYCHVIVLQLWSSLNKTRGVAFLGGVVFDCHVLRGIRLSQIPESPPILFPPSTGGAGWISVPQLKNWGRKRYSQEFVFPSFRRSSGELLVWIPTKTLHFVSRRARVVQRTLGKASDNSLPLEDFFGPPKTKIFIILTCLVWNTESEKQI